jgi:hypothetical protein
MALTTVTSVVSPFFLYWAYVTLLRCCCNNHIIIIIMSRDDAIGITTAIGWTAEVRFLAGARFFSSSQRPDRLWGPSASYPMGTGGSFPADKAAGAWSWPLISI